MPFPIYESINDVAVLPDGDVVAAGSIQNSSSSACGPDSDMLVARYDGASGAVEWSTIISGGSGPGLGHDSAGSIAVDSNGDVFAGGATLAPDDSEHRGAIVKLDGATGASLWSILVSTAGGACTSTEGVTGLAIDGDDNVVASVVRLNGSDRNFRVLEVDGTTHALLWDYVEPTATNGEASDVAVDGAGDVLAVGRLMSGSSGTGFAAVKLSGATGAELWKQTSIPGGLVNRVTLDASGDLLMAGSTTHFGEADFTVAKLANGNGAELWRRVVNGSTSGAASAAVVASSGTIFAAGQVSDAVHLVALNPSNGSVIWSRQDYGVFGSVVVPIAGRANDIALLANGNPVATVQAFCQETFSQDCPQHHAFAVAAADGTKLWRATRPARQNPLGFTLAVTPADVVVGGQFDGDATVLKLDGDDGSFSNCGDGNLESGEECDDGNVAEHDCCTQSCQFGTTCNGNCNAGVCEFCGNGAVEAGEGCDDGNVADGDCCSSTCVVDPWGTPCDDGNPATTDDHCSFFGPVCVACGNGIVDDISEQCDDPTPGSCCTPSCQWEPDDAPCDDGLACSTVDRCRSLGAGSATVCEPRSGDCCGDGVIQDTMGETCDAAGSPCCSSCQVNYGTSCNYGSPHPACNPGTCGEWATCVDGPSICSCCSAHAGGGCSNSTCQQCVVNLFPSCNSNWTASCVAVANHPVCASSCNCATTTTTTSSTSTTTTSTTSTTTTPTTSTTTTTNTVPGGSTTTLPNTSTTSTTTTLPNTSTTSTTTTMPGGSTTTMADTSTTTTAPITTTTSTTTTTLPSPCPATPGTDCLAPGVATLLVRDGDDAQDQIKWKWTKGPQVTALQLGDPRTIATYALCVYDSTGGVDSRVASLAIAPGPTWIMRPQGDYNYKDKTGSQSGVIKGQLRIGAAGKSKAQIQAKGVNIPMPAPISMTEFFDQDGRVTVQLRNNQTSTCWTTEFTSAIKNLGTQYKAKFKSP